MIENRLTVLPKASSARITPIRVSGSEDMIASGCRKLLNCEARIM